MARNDERKAAKKTASPELWNLLTRGLLAAILLSTVGPKVVRELRGDPPAESVAEDDTREAPGEDEREEDKDEAGEEEDENRPRPRSGTAVAAWRPFGGGGGGGGSYSKADVTACNRAAQASFEEAPLRLGVRDGKALLARGCRRRNAAPGDRRRAR